ncbi:peroxiredoxin-like family protein [Flocculibacter collagenilyticus]|uniref:peroxiredoxin-like family protein n=1 Tax=Flocculibacter collagenilyticus TaxID=2744479 RepID=UPI0018F43A40|nr:peroxiredoxin-like family protein [Flocculibacter collagenilyticus]
MRKATTYLFGNVIGFIIILLSFNVHAQQAAFNIYDSPTDIKPLLPGMTVENICLPDSNNKKSCLHDMFANKSTVLIVYRGGWCPYCNAQLNRLQKIESDLVAMGYQLIGVAPESAPNQNKTKAKSELKYQLLADNQLTLAKSLGLAYFLDDKTAQMYRSRLGVDFVDIKNDSRVALPVPAVFIIDRQGLVHFQYANPNYKVRLNEQLLLDAAKYALQDMR